MTCRSSRPEMFCKKGVLRNFAKFTGNGCARATFLMTLQAQVCNFIKQGTQAQVFACEVCEISKNAICTEQLWENASGLGLEDLTDFIIYSLHFTVPQSRPIKSI